MKQRVAITGIGAITPIGSGVDELWAGVRAGRSSIRAIGRFNPDYSASKVAGEVDFDPLQHMAPKRARRLDRFSQFALVSSQMALADAGMSAHEAACAGAGIYIGSALGGV
ncbi:MAG TPA: beta-ketoacyl synthase N-terminal-like domain-containing protein, partial [Thermomicrobiales bacterium]|nr:beta-ketoacyl synthase N-terminal-like domain-containing protein [Thermomicrobiales bacterium]